MIKKLDIVITMAGLGNRFRKAGYFIPKYMIEVHGKTLFEWSLESLEGYRAVAQHYIFIVQKADHACEFIQSKCSEMGIENIHIIELDGLTNGQATTALRARQVWDPCNGLLIYNIDTYVVAGYLKHEEIKGDGFIPCFCGEGDHWSFVRTDKNGKAVEIREKSRISDFCTLGAYYFSSCSLYETIYQEYYSDPSRLEHGEKYIAPLYNYMVWNGKSVYITLVPADKVHVLGTPEELEVFQKDFSPSIDMT